MAVAIRMRRMGRKNQPHFRIVATDVRNPRDGRFLEILGTYDPLVGGKNFSIKKERMLYWLGVGAQVSDAVATLLAKEGIGIERAAEKKEAAKKKKAKEK